MKCNLKDFSIIDFCRTEPRTTKGMVHFGRALKKLHDRYGWRYKDMSDKVNQEFDLRKGEITLVRCNWVTLMRRDLQRLPLREGHRVSHIKFLVL